MVHPNLKVVPGTEELLPDGFAASFIGTTKTPSERLETLDDVHRKEVAFCKQAIVDEQRQLDAFIDAKDAEIAKLRHEQTDAKMATDARRTALAHRLAKAEAYLAVPPPSKG